jgi:hypothetical protein
MSTRGRVMNKATIVPMAKCVIIGITLFSLAMSVPARGAAQEVLAPRVAEPKRMEETHPTLEVVSASNLEPLAGATVWVRGTGGRIHTWEAKTDGKGRYEIVPPDEATRWFDVFVTAPGHVTGHVGTTSSETEIEVELERSETIGGLVLGEHGRPLKGARILPIVCSPVRDEEGRPLGLPKKIDLLERIKAFWPVIATSPNRERAIATSDEDGRWRCDALPVDTPAHWPVWLMVMHPEHVTIVYKLQAQVAREFSRTSFMTPGVSIAGTVVGPSGRPVRGATVVVMNPPYEETVLRLTTDRDGRFESTRCLDPSLVNVDLLVQATGLAWAVHHVDRAHRPAQRVIRLTRRRPLEGRVVDDRGNPVAGAFVWSSRDVLDGLIEWETRSDPAGRFVWYDAPTTGKFRLDVFKRAFKPAGHWIERPETVDVTITLRQQ